MASIATHDGREVGLSGGSVRYITFLLIGIVAAVVFAQDAEATLWISGDRGGTILEYAERYAQVRQTGEQVIIDGRCLSACTMVIGMVPRDHICATPKAMLGFHAAFVRTPDGGTRASTDATTFMMKAYPPEVRKWIKQHGGLTTRMIFLMGSELAGFVPTCGSTAGASARVSR
jgi:hypothetical protein